MLVLIAVGLVVLLIAVISVVAIMAGKKGAGVTGLIAAVILLAGVIWWLNCTASGIRMWKDFTSDLNNGIEREITITAEDGREIFHYVGKFDIDTDHDKYIKFETEDGKRFIIYYGVQDTILIQEK